MIPMTGVMVITINNHGWEDGDFIKFDNNSITFTCALDNNQTEHSYPRAGSDPFASKCSIFEAEEDTFKVQVGVSSDTSAHTFVRASQNGLKKKRIKYMILLFQSLPQPLLRLPSTSVVLRIHPLILSSVH